MKKIIMASLAMLISASSWGARPSSSREIWNPPPCAVYEYAEIKDMTDAELQKNIDKMKIEYLSFQRSGNNMLEAENKAGMTGEQQSGAYYKVSQGCQDQYRRLKSVQEKRNISK